MLHEKEKGNVGGRETECCGNIGCWLWSLVAEQGTACMAQLGKLGPREQ